MKTIVVTFEHNSRKMKKRAILTFIICLFLAPVIQAGDYPFRNFSTDDGLPDNSVRASYQDSNGLMWFCTRDGICMYDGLHFKPLEDESCDILNGLAMCLSEDRQHRLWFVTTKGIGFHDLETGETRTVYRSSGGLIGAADIAIDRTGKVWFAAEDILCWDPSVESLMDYSPMAQFSSAALSADGNGNIWFLDDAGSLYRFDARTNTFARLWVTPTSERSSKLSILSDGKGHILFSASGGRVLQADILTYDISPLYITDAKEIRCIIPLDDGTSWLGTDQGIIVVGEDGRFSHVTYDVSDPFSLAGEDVWSMFKDKQGNIWVGLFYNGLSEYKNTTGLIKRYYGKKSGGILSGDMIRPILQIDDRHLMVGAEDGGLSLLDLSDGTAEDIAIPSLDGSPSNFQGLCMYGKDIWIASFGHGVFRMDASTKKVTKNYLSDLSAATVYATSTGEIFLGTTSGLYSYDREADRFRSRPEIGSAFVHAIWEDSRGTLWIGTYGEGIWIESGGRLLHVTPHEGDYNLSSDYITSIREDSRNRVWICTENGGACYVPLEEIKQDGSFRFRNLSRKEGLISSIVSCIQEDLDHVLWLTTPSGIIKLDPDDFSILEIYREDHGNTLNQYAYGSACATSSGRLFFGTSKGLISFSPSSQDSRYNGTLYITEIRGNGPSGSFRITQDGRSTIATEKIRVKYSDLSALTIHYACPDFQSSRSALFETVLSGGRRTLSQWTTSGEAFYTDLAPGKYELKITKFGGPRQSRTLEIEVIPPFYRSTLAYVLYLLSILAITYFLVRQINHLRRLKMERKVEQLETEMQKELYDAKINFFTNITHEIRTPLSLIKMPLDKMIQTGNYTERNRDELLTMQANADRLLSLTNQLLDLRKMEKQQIRPTFLTNDLSALMRKICERFIRMAETQHIKLETVLPEGSCPVECASDMVEKIIGNLLSNAFKYGNGYIRVSLEQVPENDRVRIRVDSDGERIQDKDADRIFEKFYQAGPARLGKGTGLGLPYARSLASLHNGSLILDRNVQEFNSFVLELPVHQEGIVDLSSSKTNEEFEDNVRSFDNALHTILVVEDDPEMRGYLSRELGQEYNVLAASNGEDALEIIGHNRIDLVVSDIMMPGIDGCTLCNRIKSSMEFCHIPVILLTAAVGMETRIETLEAGADGYIEKPFTIGLLQANIANLFKNREIANRQFTSSPLSHFNSVVTGGMDKEFMDNLHEAVMKHLADPDLGVETLTFELGTSKSTLYRKVTANTGLNINEYIRVSRLKKSAELLSTGKYRISEVAYMTGFSSPSYFATCFQKQFNVPPSAFLKGLKG